MREPVHTTLVALEPPAGDLSVDSVVGGLGPAEMAALYRDSDVLLKLSRVEGLGLAPVEGFHSGLPCVVTPYTGHEEYARHVPAFLPRPIPWRGAAGDSGGFSLALYMRHREWRAAVAFLAAIGFLLVRMRGRL